MYGIILGLIKYRVRCVRPFVVYTSCHNNIPIILGSWAGRKRSTGRNDSLTYHFCLALCVLTLSASKINGLYNNIMADTALVHKEDQNKRCRMLSKEGQRIAAEDI